MPKASDRLALKKRALKSLATTTPEEEASIDKGIAADRDNHELGKAFFARAKRLRGPQKAPTKRLVSLRLDPAVLDHFRATGPGWQSRINQALKKAAGV
ncbi:MAG: hypothetical protein EPN26_12175 [Rhodospirillales bacterium]|nr:MAG: hypothetical protein EPN26_12175 [Rhodospirillales bacterium]